MNNLKSKTRVLIVDDEPSILLSLEFLMKKEGYEVYIARDGDEAIEIINSVKPHIVLLDLMMPKVDGYEVCKFIRSESEIKQSKIIILSAKNSEEDIEKGYSHGANLYVAKPFSTRSLVKKVNFLATDLITNSIQ